MRCTSSLSSSTTQLRRVMVLVGWWCWCSVRPLCKGRCRSFWFSLSQACASLSSRAWLSRFLAAPTIFCHENISLLLCLLSLSLSFHVLLSILYLSSFFFSLAFSFTFSLQKSQCSSGSRAYSSAISSFLLEFFIFIFSKEEVISI